MVAGAVAGRTVDVVMESLLGLDAKTTIAGTDISGRSGFTAAEAGNIGMAEGAGTAIGKSVSAAAITAMIPGLQPLAPVVLAAVFALELWKAKVIGAAQQAEFLEFEKMGMAMDRTTDLFNRFNQMEGMTTKGLRALADSATNTVSRFSKLEAVSTARAKA